MQVREQYTARPMEAGSSLTVGSSYMGGFLCTVAGTLTITDANGTVLVNALPVSAGAYIPIPIRFSSSAGGTVSLTTAAGTLLV